MLTGNENVMELMKEDAGMQPVADHCSVKNKVNGPLTLTLTDS